MIGKAEVHIPSLTVQTPAQVEVLSLSDFSTSVESSINNNLLDINVNYGVKEVKVEQQVFNNANVNIIFSKLDVDILSELNTLLAQVSQNNDPQMMNEQMQKMTMIASQLLVNNPELSISDLSVETPEGKIQSQMLVSLDHKLYDPANPMSLVAAAKADAKGNGPAPFFEKFGLKPMLDMYVEQGFLLRENSALSFDVQFEQGKLVVNGNQIPF